MSVAFRRESDEEHLEPKFELPIPSGPNLVTQRGLEMIQTRVGELEAELRVLTDEAEITAARRVLRYWLTRQASAQLVPPPDGTAAAFGTTVDFTLNGKPRTITIVGDDEARPADGLLAFSAPLARALIGGEVGEVLPFGGTADAIEITGIAVTPV